MSLAQAPFLYSSSLLVHQFGRRALKAFLTQFNNGSSIPQAGFTSYRLPS
jgi:hypothetical protein